MNINYYYRICYLGDRLLTSDSVTVDGVMMCIKNSTGPIYKKFCHLDGNETTCDQFFKENVAYTKPGIPGLASNVFQGKLYPVFIKIYMNSFKPYYPPPKNFGGGYRNSLRPTFRPSVLPSDILSGAYL
jgi:hypothetical protein